MARLYSNLKFVEYRNHIKALRERRVVAPVHIRIKPINLCNHDCWYCAYRASQLQLGEDMAVADRIPEKKMAELVQDIVDLGVKAVTFSGGGEPLLYKTLPRYVRRLHDGGVKVATLTNGSNLKGRMADAFADCGTWVRISLDAWDDASYSRQRGVAQGQFSHLLKNLRSFIARGSKCVLGVSLIVGHENHTHIAKICTLMRDVGVDHVKIAAAIVANDVRENNEYHGSIRPEVTRQIKTATKLNTPTFSVIDHYHETEERFMKDYDSCPFLLFLTVVGADQNVYTCQDKAYSKQGMLGSIREQSFKKFWFSEENRKQIFEFNPSENCRHHCVSHNKNLALKEIMSVRHEHRPFV